MIQKLISLFDVLTIGASIACQMGWLSRKDEKAYDKTKESVIAKSEKIIDKTKRFNLAQPFKAI